MSDETCQLNDGCYPKRVAEPGLYEIMTRIRTEELRVGDVVPFSTHTWTITELKSTPDNVDFMTVCYVDLREDGSKDAGFHNVGRHASWAGVARPVIAVPTTSRRGGWNGTCRACGRGTYTGFLSIEHEGGGCP